jgi:hypothetical protein
MIRECLPQNLVTVIVRKQLNKTLVSHTHTKQRVGRDLLYIIHTHTKQRVGRDLLYIIYIYITHTCTHDK